MPAWGLQIMSSLGVAAILAAVGYVIRLERRMGALEARKVQTGQKSLPQIQDNAKFWDTEVAKQTGTGVRRVTVPSNSASPSKGRRK
jgi:hypothetical protein